jgi:predicted ATPase
MPLDWEIAMGSGFSRLSISGYRRLRSVDIRLRPLNVLIGANGVGKSSLLDVIRLLAAAAEGRLEKAVTDAGGFSSLLTADGATLDLFIAAEADRGKEPSIRYELDLAASGLYYGIGRELLTPIIPGHRGAAPHYIASQASKIRYRQNGHDVKPDWDYRASETALSQVPRNHRDSERFRQSLVGISPVYHSLDVSRRSAVRNPQVLTHALAPGIDGEDLVSCLYTIRETDRARFEIIEDTLRAAFPTFERLDFPPFAGGRLMLGWRDRDFDRPFHAGELSEGTLRFLWLAAILLAPELPSIILIDEPEVSLHPQILHLVADLLRETSERTQLVIATHSDRLVRSLSPHELLICDQDSEGGMITRRADELDLSGWLEDYTMDQLWSKGILGGRS